MASSESKKVKEGKPAKGRPVDKDEAPVLCEICGEFDATGGCAGPHAFCRACDTACTLMHEKLFGKTETPPTCPIAGCDEFLRVARVSGAPRRLARLIPLSADSPTYADVAKLFGKTMDAQKISRIFRVENPALLAVHEACRERMEKEGSVRRKVIGANEKTLFHATTRAAAGSIVREGFDAHRAGQSFGTALGPGIYVASDASFSHGYSSEDAAGLRAMFVCSVFLGDTSGGPRSHSKSDAPHKGGVPAQYAVYREQQVLPMYLIHYNGA